MDRSPTSHPRIVRSLLTVLGLFAWLCAAVTIRQGLLLASQSPLLWGVAVLGILGGTAAWGVALRVSDYWIEAGRAHLAEFLRRTREIPTAAGHRAGGGLLLFGRCC